MADNLVDESSAPVGPLPPRRLPFCPALDGLRGVAVLLVISYHLQVIDPKLYARDLPKGGFLGVEMFFVLSGFLITALLLREQTKGGGVDFRDFYRRRALRLLPALLLLVCADVAYAFIAHVPGKLERSSVISVIFYYANWKIVTAHSLPPITAALAHLWSLSVEEQFYLVWPLILVLLFGLRRRLLAITTAISAAILTVVIVRATLVRHTDPAILYYRTDMQADTLLIGALAAQLWVRRAIPKKGLVTAAYLSTAFVVVCVARLRLESRFLYNGGYTVFAAAVAVIIISIVDDARSLISRILASRPLRAIGRVSYGLYLWHFFVIYVIGSHTRHWSQGERVVGSLVITATVTMFSWYVVEKPFLRLKDALPTLQGLARANASGPPATQSAESWRGSRTLALAASSQDEIDREQCDHP